LKKGYEVTIIAQHDKDEIVKGIKVIALRKSKNRIDRMLGLTIQIFIHALKQKADIYHFHDPELLPIGVLLKIFSRKKIIYDVHEDYGKQVLSRPYLPQFPQWSRRGISILINFIERFSTGFFDGVITATDDILNKFTYHKAAISIKNYPVISYFSTEGNGGKEQCENGKVFNLVYTGHLSKERGLIEMIQSLSFINQPVKLSIFGSIDMGQVDSYLGNIQDLKKVDFLGWIEHRKVLKLLNRYDAGMICLHPLPNYVTALPIKLFEYMAAGLPVIASNFPILREIVEGNKCGVCVDPLNVEEIVNAIQYIMSYGNELGENGRKAVLQKYSWEKESIKLTQFYRDILRK
jgi:glycosyltransferase involved in cell wall biosynthesis